MHISFHIPPRFIVLAVIVLVLLIVTRDATHTVGSVPTAARFRCLRVLWVLCLQVPL